MSVEAWLDVRQKRSIYRVHYALPKMAADEEPPRPCFSKSRGHARSTPAAAAAASAPEIQRYGAQVAGHQNGEAKQYLGVLQCNNGTILKPIVKEAHKREIDFYNTLADTTNKDLIALRQFVPEYHGWKKFTYNGYENDYLILEDLAIGMLEPCILDAKMGRRTWDPLATEDKIRAEKAKYVDCKREVAFCVPGFQVFKVDTGKLHKYNKEYGKKLNGSTVREALKIFLNASGRHMCRSLVLQFLTQLWRLQRWAARQRAVHLYSASLLLVYDAQRLRECCGEPDSPRIDNQPRCATATAHPPRRRSVHSETGSSFSGQLSPKGPVYRRISSAPLTPMGFAHAAFSPAPRPHSSTPWHEALDRLQRSHSFHHNYDEDLSKVKLNYRALLEQLCTETPGPKPWVTVKVIDFVHAFFEEDEPDLNFSEGVDNVVMIFEEFLRSSEEL